MFVVLSNINTAYYVYFVYQALFSIIIIVYIKSIIIFSGISALLCIVYTDLHNPVLSNSKKPTVHFLVYLLCKYCNTERTNKY